MLNEPGGIPPWYELLCWCKHGIAHGNDNVTCACNVESSISQRQSFYITCKWPTALPSWGNTCPWSSTIRMSHIMCGRPCFIFT